MFTGLVSQIGTVRAVETRDGLSRFEIVCGFDLEELSLGASILHSGVCLTVVAHGALGADKSWYAVEAVPETLSKTILGTWRVGTKVNLELSLKLGDTLGGHFVFGHVDGVGDVVSVTPEGPSYRVRVRPPVDLARFFAAKGSVALDGVSLTIAAALPDGCFEVVIIPHTWEVTTLSALQAGSHVNLEVDMLARYVARLSETGEYPDAADADKARAGI